MLLPRNVGAYTLQKEIGEIVTSKVFDARHVFSGKDVNILAVDVKNFELGSLHRNKMSLGVKTLRGASDQHLFRTKETFFFSIRKSITPVDFRVAISQIVRCIQAVGREEHLPALQLSSQHFFVETNKDINADETDILFTIKVAPICVGGIASQDILADGTVVDIIDIACRFEEILSSLKSSGANRWGDGQLVAGAVERTLRTLQKGPISLEHCLRTLDDMLSSDLVVAANNIGDPTASSSAGSNVERENISAGIEEPLQQRNGYGDLFAVESVPTAVSSASSPPALSPIIAESLNAQGEIVDNTSAIDVRQTEEVEGGRSINECPALSTCDGMTENVADEPSAPTQPHCCGGSNSQQHAIVSEWAPVAATPAPISPPSIPATPPRGPISQSTSFGSYDTLTEYAQDTEPDAGAPATPNDGRSDFDFGLRISDRDMSFEDLQDPSHHISNLHLAESGDRIMGSDGGSSSSGGYVLSPQYTVGRVVADADGDDFVVIEKAEDSK